MRFKLSDLFQSLTMAIVLSSFVSANLGNESAMRLWLEGWESISALIALGVGMKMYQRAWDRSSERKYNRTKENSITVPDGEEP